MRVPKSAIFGWVLRQVTRAELLKDKTIGIDATTLEANAAMKTIVRARHRGELHRVPEVVRGEAGDEAALRRMDRRRKKKASNAEWVNPYDPEAEITRVKDGRTALAYKAEHAVDMDTGVIVTVTAHGGAVGDTSSVGETQPAAGEAVAELTGLRSHIDVVGVRIDIDKHRTRSDSGDRSGGRYKCKW